MKKILLLIPFILLSMIGYSQKNVYGDMKVWGKLENVDTTKIKKGILFGDTTFQNTAFIPDSIVHWSDTTTLIATKYDLDTLSNSVYDSLNDKWSINGNSGTNHDINFIGTTDNKNLVFKANNKLSGKIDIANNNTFWGYSAQSKSIRATQNVVAIGSYALENNGSLAGGQWYSGHWNTAIGSYAMYKNTYGSGNVAIGADALRESTTARNNTAVGWDALHFFIGSAGGNTALGNGALTYLKNGAGNTVVGDVALYQDTLGSSNTVVGQWALQNVRSGSNNAVLGANAGYTTNKCSATTLIGYAAGYSLPKGDSCVFVGYASGNYETSTNRFYIDNQSRGNLANGRANAFMYGEFNALTSLQKLTLNSNVTVKEKLIVKNIPTGTNDTILIIEKDTIKKKLLPAASLLYWSDTTTYIATKHDVDTLSNSVYDSLSNHYDLIHAFKPDSTSSGCFNNFYYKQITGCDVNNLYIKADTTKFSNYIKLPKFANNTTEPLLKVLPSGRIDTNQTRSIMGLHLDSLDVGEIDLTTLNVTNSNVTNENTTYSNVMVATNQSLILPNLGSNYEPVLSVADLSGTIDTTQVKSIYAIDFDSLKITNYVVIGGVPNVGYKFTLADDGIYSFANSSYGIGNLYCFNAGKKTAFTQYSFDIDGVVTFEISTTDEVVNAELDGYEICLYYSGGTYYIKNTSGGARNYILSIKYY